MITKQVYKHAITKEVEGETIQGFKITTEVPEGLEYTTEGLRLIAEEGMVLISSEFTAEDRLKVIDVQSADSWSEVEEPISESEDKNLEQPQAEDLSPEGDLYREFLASRGISRT